MVNIITTSRRRCNFGLLTLCLAPRCSYFALCFHSFTWLNDEVQRPCRHVSMVLSTEASSKARRYSHTAMALGSLAMATSNQVKAVIASAMVVTAVSVLQSAAVYEPITACSPSLIPMAPPVPKGLVASTQPCTGRVEPSPSTPRASHSPCSPR